MNLKAIIKFWKRDTVKCRIIKDGLMVGYDMDKLRKEAEDCLADLAADGETDLPTPDDLIADFIERHKGPLSA